MSYYCIVYHHESVYARVLQFSISDSVRIMIPSAQQFNLVHVASQPKGKVDALGQRVLSPQVQTKFPNAATAVKLRPSARRLGRHDPSLDYRLSTISESCVLRRTRICRYLSRYKGKQTYKETDRWIDIWLAGFCPDELPRHWQM